MSEKQDPKQLCKFTKSKWYFESIHEIMKNKKWRSKASFVLKL